MSLKTYLTAAVFSLFAHSAHATTVNLTVGGDWSEFRFDIGYLGGAWLDTNDTPGVAPGVVEFYINLTEAATLQVTDAWRDGDMFEVFANGNSLGSTSGSQATDQTILGNYSGAFDDGDWSTGEWLLAAGQYTITGFITQMPEARGRGALRVTEIVPTPLPGGVILLLTGGAGFAAISARKKKASKAEAV
ncbi:MAG: hypothetical protein AAF754_03055 [Pseudomonadota bacterium]